MNNYVPLGTELKSRLHGCGEIKAKVLLLTLSPKSLKGLVRA